MDVAIAPFWVAWLVSGRLAVVLYEKIVTGRVPPGMPAFLVSIVLTLPLSTVGAPLFASVFEIPFLRYRRSSQALRRPQARAEGAPG